MSNFKVSFKRSQKVHNTLEAVFPSLVSHSATISNFLFKIPLIHDLLPTNENGHLGKLYPLISNISPSASKVLPKLLTIYLNLLPVDLVYNLSL